MNRYVAMKWIVTDGLQEVSESRILRHLKGAQSRDDYVLPLLDDFYILVKRAVIDF